MCLNTRNYHKASNGRVTRKSYNLKKIDLQ